MSLITREGKGSKLTIQEMDGNLLYLESLGLAGTQYVFVSANGTDVENAAELQAAYDTAKTMSPTASNRITVIAAPGNYNFEGTQFVMDTEYIDLVSLDGNRSVVFNSSDANGRIRISANDVFVKGVDVGTKRFNIATNLNLIKIENCKGGNLSFGENVVVSGTFTNCEGGTYSFGGLGTASGTFIDCQGGVLSFAGDGTASGTFINCEGGGGSFGRFSTGTFTGCRGGINSFGNGFFGGEASGVFNGCIGDTSCFGTGNLGGTASGTFINCQGGIGSFGTGTASGIFINCQGGSNSFSFAGVASGTFTNCIGDGSCFAGQGIASGTFNYCIGGLESFGSGNLASGIFTNCVGGDGSFTAPGYGGDLTGKLYYCRTSGYFNTVSSGGRTYYCVDGNGNTNNQ